MTRMSLKTAVLLLIVGTIFLAVAAMLPSCNAGQVNAGGSAEYTSPHSIESILLQEVAGLVRVVGESDEWKSLLEKQVVARAQSQGSPASVFASVQHWNFARITEILPKIGAIAKSFRIVEWSPATGSLGYSYCGTIRGVRFSRQTTIKPGRLTLTTTLAGRIRSESRRQGPAIGTGTLTGVTVVLDAKEANSATTILVRLRAVVSVSVRGRSHCRFINRVVSRRGPAIAANAVGKEASERCGATCREIIRRARGIAATGRRNTVVWNIAQYGLRVSEWD